MKTWEMRSKFRVFSRRGLFLKLILTYMITTPSLSMADRACRAYKKCFGGEKTLSYSKLVNFINGANSLQQPLESINETLSQLKLEYPEIFNTYLLMYRSRSLQQSSFSHPRAILIGPSGQFYLSFNGDPNHRGFQNLEVMEFHPEGQRFEFREIQFLQKGKTNFSPANPRRCLNCHQDYRRKNIDPRPNWEPYALWPGAFGSESGEVPDKRSIYDLRRNERLNTVEDALFLQEHALEKAKLEEFVSTIKEEHPRYKHLGEFNWHLTVNVTETLVKYNFQRVVRLAKEALRSFPEYEKAFTELANCYSLSLPEKVREWHQNSPLLPQLPPIQTEMLTDKDNIYKTSLHIDLLFEPLGVRTADWSMDFRTEGGRLAFRERFGSPKRPGKQIKEAYRALYPENEKIRCKELKSEVRTELSSMIHLQRLQYLGEKLRVQVPQEERLIDRCTNCHVYDATTGYIPYIPFNHEDQLRAALKQGVYPRGSLADEILYRTGTYAYSKDQMPPGPTSEKLRREFQNYIKGIMANP